MVLMRVNLEHFQEKCEAVFRLEMRGNKKIERFGKWEKTETFYKKKVTLD